MKMSFRKGAVLCRAFSSFSVMLTFDVLRSMSAFEALLGYSGSVCCGVDEESTLLLSLFICMLDMVLMPDDEVCGSLRAISLNSACLLDEDTPLVLSSLSFSLLVSSTWLPFSLAGIRDSDSESVCFVSSK